MLDDVSSGYNLSKINSNFDKIEDEFNDRVLYRDNLDTEPNSMQDNLDMNSYKILNANSIYSQSLFLNGIAVTVNNLVEVDTSYVDALRADIADTSNTALGDGLVGVKQPYTGGIARTQHSKNTEIMSAMDFCVGDGVVDDTAQLNLAFASPGDIYLPPGKVFLVTAPIICGVAGKRVYGSGKIRAKSTFAGSGIIQITNSCTLEGFSVDGSAILSGNWVSGIIATASLSNVYIRNLNIMPIPFIGINITRAGGAYTHSNINIENCRVDGSGWIGIDCESANGCLVRGNYVTRTGLDSISFWYSTNFRGVDNYLNKASPPPIVFSGSGGYGGVEKGGFIYLDPHCGDGVISNNNCYDNRNAGFDGIILGEDGVTEFGPMVISGNTIKLCGGFGIDVHSNFSVTGNVIDGAEGVGIFIGRDLGGVLRNSTVTGNVIRNVGYSAGGCYGILMASNLGAVNQFDAITISGNTVVDDRGTQFTDYGFGVNRSNATFNGIAVIDNNLFHVKTSSFLDYGTGVTSGIFVEDNVYKAPDKAITGATPSALGYMEFTCNNGGATTITDIVDPYPGQSITVLFLNGNTTLALGGPNMYGNGGVNKTMGSLSVGKANRIGATWYWTFG